MKKYTYTGPKVMAFTLNVDFKDMDIILSPGQTVELPEENEHIKGLVFKGYLTEESEIN